MRPSPSVVRAREVTAATPEGDTVAEQETVGPGTGFEALRQSVLHCAPGRSKPRGSRAAEEVLFVLRGRGTLHLDGAEHSLEPEAGAYLAPGEQYELENPGPEPLELVCVRIPDPDRQAADTGSRSVVQRLADQTAHDATSQREFRIVAGPGSGLRSATHFVGYIPTARAPDHFHTYDEVIYVLDGEGVFYAGAERQLLERGSCIQLPARTVHRLENTGSEVMRVLAVFKPAGSPAAAYYPDGTLAYGDAPPLQRAHNDRTDSKHSERRRAS